jgi:hypothetical protein
LVVDQCSSALAYIAKPAVGFAQRRIQQDLSNMYIVPEEFARHGGPQPVSPVPYGESFGVRMQFFSSSLR